MVHAFVMVKTSTGDAETVLEEVRDFNGVAEAHVVAGDWDLVVEMTADEVYEILDTVSTGIQGITGVTDTKTYVSMSV